MLQCQEKSLAEAKRACLFLAIRLVTMGVFISIVAMAIWAAIK